MPSGLGWALAAGIPTTLPGGLRRETPARPKCAALRLPGRQAGLVSVLRSSLPTNAAFIAAARSGSRWTSSGWNGCARSSRGFSRERALLEARVTRIERRCLRWVWKTDPTVPGSTIALTTPDEVRACAWLRDVAKVEPDQLTPRAFDQCLWAAALCLSHRYHEDEALLKVKRALQAEELWRSKTWPAT
jgi:hypothetical protein